MRKSFKKEMFILYFFFKTNLRLKTTIQRDASFLGVTFADYTYVPGVTNEEVKRGGGCIFITETLRFSKGM